MVAAAIRTLTRRGDLDCVVVIRGGGARNELATFDAESIALAIATSPIPVLTGLGHEIDRSVADEVAHTALKTPTACAGALIDAVHDYQVATERSWAAIAALRTARPRRASPTSLSDRAHRIARRTHAAVERADERLATRLDRVRVAPDARLDEAATGMAVGGDRLRRRGTTAGRRRAAPCRRARRPTVPARSRPTCCGAGGASPAPPSGDVVRSVDRARRRRHDRHPLRRRRDRQHCHHAPEPRGPTPMTIDTAQDRRPRPARLRRGTHRARLDPARARELRRRRRPARRTRRPRGRADRLCRDRISTARMRIDEVIADLDGNDAADGTGQSR